MKRQLLLLTILALLLPLAAAVLAGEPFMVKDINPRGDSSPQWLTDVNGTLFFRAFDSTNGYELWKSDGTSAGTVMVKDINPWGDSSPQWLTDVNGTLFFRAADANGNELWKSDGTEAGTVMVKDIYPGAAGSNLTNLTDVNGTLFFVANDGTHGWELWKSDGTEAGTVMVNDINSMGDSNPQWLTNVNGTLFFTATNYHVYPFLGHEPLIVSNGRELWKSDGTEANTVIVKDIYPGVDGSNPMGLTNVNGTLFFQANNGTNGVELWKSDGTEANTVIVKDINPLGNSYPAYLTNVNGILFFAATDGDGTHGHELWKSDGTEAGTVMVKDINPGSSNSNPFNLINVNGTLFFAADDGMHGIELWKSDGSEAGTVMVKNICPEESTAPVNTNVNGTLFFCAEDGTYGNELWKSDGTEAGTVMVKDINPGVGNSYPAYLTNVNGTLFFAANDGTNGTELWRDVQNDECQDSLKVSSGQTYYGSNYGATGYTYYSYDSNFSCGYNDFTDVWYYFQPQVGGRYTISVGSDEFDTTLNVFNACGEYRPLACNDDYSLQTTDSQVDLDMVKGKHYYIRVAGFDGQMGSFKLTVTAGACTELALSDLNGDCAVDFRDFAIMASEWLKCNMSPADLCGE